MPVNQPAKWYHCNRYNAESACEHCTGIIRHEPWCAKANTAVAYAYAAVLHDAGLTLDDHLRLHALGVAWTANGNAAPPNACACRPSPERIVGTL